MSTVNTYVATEPLFQGLARAANKGDRIQSTPEDIERRGWKDKVKLVEDQPAEREPGIKAIMAEVGDDKDAAQTALDAELARPEGEQRKTLVEALQGKLAKLDTV